MAEFRDVMETKMATLSTFRESPRDSDRQLSIPRIDSSSNSLPMLGGKSFAESVFRAERAREENTPAMLENMRQHLNSDSFYRTMNYNSEEEKEEQDFDFDAPSAPQDVRNRALNVRLGHTQGKLAALQKLSGEILSKL